MCIFFVFFCSKHNIYVIKCWFFASPIVLVLCFLLCLCTWYISDFFFHLPFHEVYIFLKMDAWLRHSTIMFLCCDFIFLSSFLSPSFMFLCCDFIFFSSFLSPYSCVVSHMLVYHRTTFLIHISFCHLDTIVLDILYGNFPIKSSNRFHHLIPIMPP